MTAQIPAEGSLAQARPAFAAGRYEECLAACRSVLARDPDCAEALRFTGRASLRLGRPLFAITALEAARTRAPDDPMLALDLGEALLAAGRTQAAGALFSHLATAHPDHPEVALRLVNLLRDGGQPAAERALLHRAVAAHPDHPGLRCALGMALTSDNRLDDALMQFALAEHFDPGRAAIQTNIGVVLQARGDLDGAVRRYEHAVALDPAARLPHVNLATALLARLDLARGFAEMEHRTLPDYPWPLPPRWRGEDLTGRHLLVLPEQGFGDLIQYARFLPALAANGGRVSVVADHPLRRLFASLPVEVVSGGARRLPEADAWVPLLSLPALLGASVEGLAAPLPLFRPEPRRLPVAGEGLRVGVVWAASASASTGYAGRALARRSCPLSSFGALAAVPGVTLFSLQKDPRAVADLRRSGLAIGDLSGELGDFADTAALIAGLDLVISVDTAVAHLAGSVGTPLWVLLGPGQADYRWGPDGEATAWYPRARLFRAGVGGWPPLVEMVAAELAQAGRLHRR